MEYLSITDELMESNTTFFTTENHAKKKLKGTRMNIFSPTNLEDAAMYARINLISAPPETEGALHQASTIY